jgi:hypothetical protein
MKASNISIIAAVTALLLAVSGPSTAEDGPFPVWWSPALELDSLDQIDARLEREIWPGDPEGLPLYKYEGDSYDSDARVEAWADSCNALMSLTADGYEGLGNPGRKLELFNLAYCRAIAMLKQAVPAENSYLREFVLNEGSVDYLPAMVFDAAGCDYLCRQRLANERRIPLSKFENLVHVESQSDTELVIRSEAFQTRLKILARGDFDSDGFDDMLVLSSARALEGTGAWTDYHLLTREASGMVLIVLHADKDDCRHYECQKSYNYPEVLRDSAGEDQD